MWQDAAAPARDDTTRIPNYFAQIFHKEPRQGAVGDRYLEEEDRMGALLVSRQRIPIQLGRLQIVSLFEQTFLETTHAAPKRACEFVVGDQRNVVERAGLMGSSDLGGEIRAKRSADE